MTLPLLLRQEAGGKWMKASERRTRHRIAIGRNIFFLNFSFASDSL